MGTEDDDDDLNERTGSDNDDDNITDLSNPHCDVNYTTDNPYTLSSDGKPWATAIFEDPAPKPPKSWPKSIAGDYILVKGKNIKIKVNRNKPARVNFVANEEFILTPDWEQMQEDMTGQDLVDLGDENFLLWWQEVEVPKPKPEKTPKKGKDNPKKKRKK